jgi:hypothetical protein
MRNPDDRSPREWAEEARICAAEARDGREEWEHADRAWILSPADCDELAERMDDLERAVWVLRNIVLGHDLIGVRAEAAMLVVKYEEDLA